jgi:hypothetical protein
MEFKLNRYTLPLIIEAEDIFSATRNESATVVLKRGWKIEARYAIVEDVFTEKKHIKSTVRTLNSKGVEQSKFFIVSRLPVEPVEVRSIWDNSIVVCRNNGCVSTSFYDMGRSLDHYNWECAACGKDCMTLTETGMSR